MKQQQLNAERLRLGIRLRACRTAAGLSRQELATRLQLSERRIGAFERGRAVISALELRDIVAALRGSISALLEPAIDGGIGHSIPLTSIERLAASDEGADLAQAFATLKAPRLRRHVVELVQELVRQESHPGNGPTR